MSRERSRVVVRSRVPPVSGPWSGTDGPDIRTTPGIVVYLRPGRNAYRFFWHWCQKLGLHVGDKADNDASQELGDCTSSGENEFPERPRRMLQDEDSTIPYFQVYTVYGADHALNAIANMGFVRSWHYIINTSAPRGGTGQTSNAARDSARRKGMHAKEEKAVASATPKLS